MIFFSSFLTTKAYKMSDDQQPLIEESHAISSSEEVVAPVDLSEEEKANEEEVRAPTARPDLSDDEEEVKESVESVEIEQKVHHALDSFEGKIAAIETRMAEKTAQVPSQIEKKMTDARVRMTGKIDGMVNRLVQRVESRVGQVEQEMDRVMDKMVDDMLNQVSGELDRQIGAFDTTVDETISQTEKTIDQIETQLTKCCQVM
jgi:hypothetical protein